MSGRRQGHKQVKGAILPSMRDQNPYPKQKDWMWKPGAASSKQQKRNLRNKCRHIIDSADPITISVGDRVIRSVCQEPDPEFGALHLFCAALDLAQASGESWAVVMNSLMDTYDEHSELSAKVLEEKDGSEAQKSGPVARLRGLLRGLVPSGLRRRHETTAEAGLHQQSGHRSAPSTEAVVTRDHAPGDRGGDGEAEAHPDSSLHAGR